MICPKTRSQGDAVTAEDLQKWEQNNIEIKTNDIVFLRTGMDERVNQDIFNRKWIGFSQDGASFLTEKGIKTIGTDACSIDSPAGHELAPGGSTASPSCILGRRDPPN